MVSQSRYREGEVEACLSVLVEIMTALGSIREHVVLIGGLVPPLLIPNAGTKHPGSLDVDIAFDHRHISDDTYREIVQILIDRGYYQKEDDQPFRFYRDLKDSSGDAVTVEVDLMSGEYGGTGKSHRHQKVQDALARKARGCDLVFDEPAEVTVSSTLPNGGKNEVTLKVPSVGPYLVTKGMALFERMKEKDAYDIYYCCRYYPGGTNALIEAMKGLVGNRLAVEGLGKIKAKFANIDSIGPTWVVNFMEIADPEEKARVQREAFEFVNAPLDGLGIQPFRS
jgi:hypothetical protein